MESQHFDFDGGSLQVCSHSDIGQRSTQEDCYAVMENNGRVLAVICDGMGGCLGGELASSAAVSKLQTVFMETPHTGKQFYQEHLDELDAAVYYLKDETGRRLGAGTTMVSVMICGNLLSWLAVGDSRLYIIRGAEIVQATRDHNYGEMLLDLLRSDSITMEQYEEERELHAALTSYLGIGDVKIYDLCTEPFALQDKDILLLTSDGLYNALDVRQILNMEERSAAQIAEAFLNALADLKEDGRDNTTFILIEYREKAAPVQQDVPEQGEEIGR